MFRTVILAVVALSLATCQPVYAGYTIYTRMQVIPQYVLVNGPSGKESRLNRGIQPLYPPTFGKKVCAAPDIYSADSASRTEVWEDSSGVASDSDVLAACPGLKTRITDEIKDIRAKAHDQAARTAGVLAVYDENYAAAKAYRDGLGASTYMRNGQTAAVYLTGFGARLGMSAAQFADYIVAENQRVAPRTYQIEDEYLRLAYGVIPNETSVSSLLAYPDQYRTFCGL